MSAPRSGDMVTPAEIRADASAKAKREAVKAEKRASRPKGRRNLARAGKRIEQVLVKRIKQAGATSRRVPGSGSIEGTEDSDVLHWTQSLGKVEIEAKARTESGWKVLDKWLGGADVLILWLFNNPKRARVFMPLTEYERMLAAIVSLESLVSEMENDA